MQALLNLVPYSITAGQILLWYLLKLFLFPLSCTQICKETQKIVFTHREVHVSWCEVNYQGGGGRFSESIRTLMMN